MTTVALPEAPISVSDAVGVAPRSRLRRALCGGEPPWARPALLTLLVATAVLYLWGLGASGWGNSFYSAAVQAGTKSWKAFFFGSFDASNFITVDKPPAALWVMELSARVFGVNAWSILVPQALEGVAAVGLLHATVRRWFGHGGALLAGAVLALTPVAALMFRFNNPDALLTLLLVAAAYAVVRAIESGLTRWLVTAATLVGFGFITKMMQAFIVVPAFALAYLVAGPPKLGRRVVQLLFAAVALAVASFWWVVAVMLVPASSRPYIGGSQNNSLWNLIFGYNGFGRLTGNEAGSVGGGTTAGSRWGVTGVLRMFGTSFGGQVSWLLPAALIMLVTGLVFTIRASRTDRQRAAFVVWGGWLLTTAAVFSLGQGIIHPYYAVALAPAIGALVGMGGAILWAKRDSIVARATMAVTLVATSAWAYALLERSATWHPWVKDVVLLGGLAAAALLIVWTHLRGWLSATAVTAAVVIGLAAPAAYTMVTVATPQSGAIPSAGPAGAGGGFGRGGPGGPGGGPTGAARNRFGGTPPQGAPPFFGGGGGFGPPGGFPAAGRQPGRTGPGGGVGGLLNGSQSNPALTAALRTDASHYTWVAAAVGANEAAGYQLASGRPVMAIGGFNGSDPAPTLVQFEQYVRDGKIHYFIAGGAGGFGGGGGPGAGSSSSVSSQIRSWVESTYTPQTIGGVTVYDLSAA
ncbi:MAG: ArnT family glycosyltransferase [Acidimicrobiales bacterium]